MKARVVSSKPFPKPWKLGLSRAEAERNDIFRQLEIDPVHEAFNSHLMSAFVTDMGKIQNRAQTKLTWRSQRKVAKAIRRAKHIGIIPWLSKRVLRGEDKRGSR
jgi:small subunit ribosomal protein S18